jgi:ABC-2 type transport system permease protein
MKKYISITYGLLRDRLRNETAYLPNILAETGSTIFYVLTYLLFINFLFGKIGSVAGYSKNDIYFMMLMGQLTFYLYANILLTTAVRIISSVRSGEFDLILLKPVNKIFYIYSSSIKPITTILVSLPNILILIYLINWQDLNLSILSTLLGFLCWVSSILILNTLLLLSSYTVFTNGEATDSVNITWSLFSINELPYNKLPKTLQLLSFSLIPTLLAGGGVTYVALNKGPATWLVFWSIVSGIISVLLFNLIWRKALNRYSSASS